jgi:hypothetical protein
MHKVFFDVPDEVRRAEREYEVSEDICFNHNKLSLLRHHYSGP